MEEERILLGMWLVGRHLEDIPKLNTHNFYYRKVVENISKGLDPISVAKATGEKLSELMKMTTETTESFYSIAFKGLLKQKIREDIQDASDLDLIVEEINTFNQVDYSVKSDSGLADEYAKELDERTKREYAKWSLMPNLQDITNGIKRKELTTISARPGVGKSAFSLQMAIGVAEQGKKVLYFPLEMSRIQTFDRLIASKGIATHKELISGKIEGANLGVALDYIDRVEKKGLFKIYEGVCDIERIINAIKDEKPYLVVIDQLTQMTAQNRFNSIRERFTYMTKTLKNVAMKENVAVFLLCQLNRNAQNSAPTLADLKESGSIEEDADNCLLLHNLEADDLQDPSLIDWQTQRPMLINLAKQRSGELGQVLAIFEPSKFKFYEQTRR